MYQGMYLMGKPSFSMRVLTSESGTFLLSSFSISDKGLQIPEVGTSSSNFSNSADDDVDAACFNFA
jgi:hypothetical protein